MKNTMSKQEQLAENLVLCFRIEDENGIYITKTADIKDDQLRAEVEEVVEKVTSVVNSWN